MPNIQYTTLFHKTSLINFHGGVLIFSDACISHIGVRMKWGISTHPENLQRL